jgi:hypothetical protein
MKRLVRISTLLILGLLVPFVVRAKSDRNEEQARRFLFCMNVNQFFYQYLLKNDPQNPGLPGYRDSRVYYRLGAALVTDGEFVTRENDKALQDVIRLLERERSEKTNLMDAEAMSCAQTLKNEVVPIIQKEGDVK